MISKALNLMSILGWTAIIAMILIIFVLNPALYFKEDFSSVVYLAKFMQTLAIFDVVMVLLGKSKGSLLGSIAQLTGRLVVVWVFLEPETHRFSLSIMIVMWAIADITRYSYYLLKSEASAAMRYNLFLILYPLGVYGEMRVINDYIRRHAVTLSVEKITMIRGVQGLIIIGTVFLYLYMLKMRSKFYAKNNQDAESKVNAKASKTS